MIANTGTLLSERARISRDLEALFDVAANRRQSFGELDAMADAIAARLAGRIAAGDRVALLAANGGFYPAMFFAAARLGAILVPLNWRLTVPELAFQIGDCAPVLLVHDGAHAETARELARQVPSLQLVSSADASQLAGSVAEPLAPRPVSSGDGLMILYTSGTTGRPKGALHTHGSSLAWTASTLASFENRLGDRQLLVAPMFHIAGICVLLNAVHRGFSLVIPPAFDAGQVWRLVEEEKITSMFAVPAMINMMREHPDATRRNHGSLRWIMCGAAPVPVALIDAYARMGIDIHQVYGSTEAHGGIAVLPPAFAHSRKGSTGLPCLGIEVKVVDAEGRDMPPGRRGDLVTRGPHLFSGYWGRPEATAESFRDGWFQLGDIGEVDADGFITIVDRSKDMIISGGENVYPAEIEDVLMRHAAVLEVAVIGRPDERWGERPLALVVRRAGIGTAEETLSAELAALCEANLAGYKRPAGYRFVGELPRNAAGKVLKHVLRAELVGQD